MDRPNGTLHLRTQGSRVNLGPCITLDSLTVNKEKIKEEKEESGRLW